MSKFNSETSFLYQLFNGNSNFIVLKPCKVIDLSILMIFIIIYKLYILHKVTFDWCLSQLVVAVRLWSRTTRYVVTEWGLEIRLCVVPSRPRSKIWITFESRSKIWTMIQIRTKIFGRLAIAHNILRARGFDRPILRQTQLETYERKV